MINGINYLKKEYPNREESDYQPSGLDLRVEKVYIITEDVPSGIIDGIKVIPEHSEIKPKDYPEYNFENCWKIEYNKPYIFEVQKQITIGKNNAQFYLPRSTLLRQGVNVYTALGDTGYTGHLSFMVINHRKGDFYISKGERFAQLIDFQVQDTDKEYDGDYQEEKIVEEDL